LPSKIVFVGKFYIICIIVLGDLKKSGLVRLQIYGKISL